MKKDAFYKICDKTSEIDENVTVGYFPTVDDLEEARVKENPEKFLYIISYFASNPLKRQGSSMAELKEYEETVKYCRDLTCKINIQ